MIDHQFDCGNDDCAMCQDKAKENIEFRPPWPWNGTLSRKQVDFLNEQGKNKEAKRFASAGDKEAETNCRGCGYNTTDEERNFYGQYQFEPDDYNNEPIFNFKTQKKIVIRQYHFCTFCVDSAWHKKKWFGGLDYKIHEAKVRLREKVLKSSGYLYLKVLRQTLEEAHYDEIHNAPYKEDDDGARIYGKREAEYLRLTFEIDSLWAKPRHLYMEALEEFGSQLDEPPCTRNLNKKQKKKLLKNLKEKLKECAII